MGAFGIDCPPEDRAHYLESGGRTDEDELRLKLSADELKMVDAWIERHPDPKPTRAQAIHRLLISALIEHPGQ
ncbi:MAG: hypothetical protein ACXW2T_11165 [Allosphingosinicella sp.]